MLLNVERVYQNLPQEVKDKLEQDFKKLKELFPNGIFTVYDLIPKAS